MKKTKPYKDWKWLAEPAKPYDEYSQTDKKFDALNFKKEELLRIRVTTYIASGVKNRFLNDCLEQRKIESVVARDIIRFYYDLLGAVPEDKKDLEHNALKQYIIDKIKFK